MLSCSRKHRFCIEIKLFLCIRRNYHRYDRKHHSLVTGGKVIKELFGFLALKLHIIRDNRTEIVVLILLALPIRYIRFNTE